MTSSDKSTCFCFLLICLMFQLASSFSVEELCARRCLYGRGGVLCNCNARHFTGKRSGMTSVQQRYFKESNKPESYAQVPEEVASKGNTFDLESDDFLHNHEALSHENKLGEVIRIPQDSWREGQFENILPSLSEKTVSSIVGSIADDADDNTSSDTNNEIHIVLMQDDKSSDQRNDEIAEDAGNDASSKVKLIMADPYLEEDQIAVTDDSTNDLRHNSDNNVAHKSISPGQNLLQLQNILRRALRGR